MKITADDILEQMTKSCQLAAEKKVKDKIHALEDHIKELTQEAKGKDERISDLEDECCNLENRNDYIRQHEEEFEYFIQWMKGEVIPNFQATLKDVESFSKKVCSKNKKPVKKKKALIRKKAPRRKLKR